MVDVQSIKKSPTQSTTRLRSSQVITDRRPALSKVTTVYGLLLISIKILGKAYSIQLVSDLRQVGAFPPGTSVYYINKTDRHDMTEIFLKVALTNPSINDNIMQYTNIEYFISVCYSCFPHIYRIFYFCLLYMLSSYRTNKQYSL
jgi:hypothetical protein